MVIPLHQGTTIGRPIGQAIGLNMHHFLFLPYTMQGRMEELRRLQVCPLHSIPQVNIDVVATFPLSAGLHC